MFRKLLLVAATVAPPGAAALAPAPTSASTWGWNGGWRHGWGPRAVVGGPVSCGYASPSDGYGCCDVRRLVPTPWGPAPAPGQPPRPTRSDHWEA